MRDQSTSALPPHHGFEARNIVFADKGDRWCLLGIQVPDQKLAMSTVDSGAVSRPDQALTEPHHV